MIAVTRPGARRWWWRPRTGIAGAMLALAGVAVALGVWDDRCRVRVVLINHSERAMISATVELAGQTIFQGSLAPSSTVEFKVRASRRGLFCVSSVVAGTKPQVTSMIQTTATSIEPGGRVEVTLYEGAIGLFNPGVGCWPCFGAD